MAKELTQAEKAAIYYHLVGKCDDWSQLYNIAKGEGTLEKMEKSSRPSMVSRWKNADHIQTAIKEISFLLQREREEFAERAVQAYKDNQENPTNGTTLAEVKQANRIQDEKTRNETLKMISDNLRYKDMDKEKDEDEEVRRFYTPMVCHECPLYLRCQKCPLDECPNA